MSIPVTNLLRLSKSKAFLKDWPIVVSPVAWRFLNSVMNVAWLSFHPALKKNKKTNPNKTQHSSWLITCTKLNNYPTVVTSRQLLRKLVVNFTGFIESLS